MADSRPADHRLEPGVGKVTERFTTRVEEYIRYRPDYPQVLLSWLQAHGIDSSWRVADIGSGTGISAKMFLDGGYVVTGVEPNAAMREASLDYLKSFQSYDALNGRAEATELPDHSVDLISSAQAFHWFDQQAVKKEWKRILRPTGMAAIFWNSRQLDGSPFLKDYEDLLQKFGTDYKDVADRYSSDEQMKIWFGSGMVDTASFPHRQTFDFDGLRGRLLSSSYAPQTGDPLHLPMLAALREIFHRHALNGVVHFEYHTRIFLGTLAPP